MENLSTEKIKVALATVPDWKKKGATIARTYRSRISPPR